MSGEFFKGFFVDKSNDGVFEGKVLEKLVSDLPAGEVLIRVVYSCLNYKDALSATGHPGVTRRFPHIPGIDAAGIVVFSSVPEFIVNQKVIVTGFDLGMNTWGGFAEFIRVPSAWVVALPDNLSLRESMIFGTAGLTASLCVDALLQHDITPDSGEVLVTGATGGVGSLAVSILAKLGYSVTALTGKVSQSSYLMSLGANSVLFRDDFNDPTGKALLKERWAGVVDSVGGNILATALKSTQYNGCVSVCGLVAGAELPTTVYPFILRGVRLIGVDSVLCPILTRLRLWEKLAGDWKPASLEAMATTVNLEELPDKINSILQGDMVGRVLLDFSA